MSHVTDFLDRHKKTQRNTDVPIPRPADTKTIIISKINETNPTYFRRLGRETCSVETTNCRSDDSGNM